MIRNTEIAYNYGGDPSIPNLNYQDMYFYATGGVPNNPGFNALPEQVQRKIIANMKRYGGAHMGYYQGDEGGSSYYEEIDPMTGMYVDPATMGFYQGYDEGIEESMPYSETTGYTMPAPSAPNYGPMGPAANYGPVGPFSQPGVGQRGLKSYKGVSVVDFLNQQGVASDYATRKQLAQTLGIGNYRGTANQNLALIEAISNNPNILNGAGTGKGGNKKYAYVDPQSGRGYTQQELEAIDAGLIADAERAIANQSGSSFNDVLTGRNLVTPEAGQKGKEEVPFSAKIGPQEKAAVAAIGVAGTAYLVNKLGRAWVAQNGQRLKDLAQAGLSADDIVKMAKSQGRAADTYKLLTSRGVSPQEANKLLKGVKFQSTPVSKQVIAGVEQAGANIQKFVEASERAQKQAQALVQFMKTQGVRDPKIMAQLEKLVPNAAKRMAMLKGIKMGTPAAASSARSFLPKAANVLKYLRFDDGGSYMPMYQGDEGGSEYIDFDNNPYSEDKEWLPGYWNDAMEILDPTGISSWDDVARAYNDPNVSKFDFALEALAALPVIGKIGKGAKIVKTAGKAAKPVSKTKKILSATGKALGRPISYPVSKIPGVAAKTERIAAAAGKLPGVVRHPLNFATFMGEGHRVLGKPINRALQNSNAQNTINQLQPREGNVLVYTPDGTVMSVDPYGSDFARWAESNAIDTSANSIDPMTGAMRLNTDKVSGPYDWKSMQKQYGTGQRVSFAYGGDSGTFSGNAYYPDGGTFIPMYDAAYGALPEYGMGSDYDMYAYGGIHIKPENKGKFTKKANAAGMGVQQFASKVLSAPKGKYSASTRKQANFAKNAAGWKKQNGGMTGQEMYVTPEQMEMLRQQGYDFDII